VSKTLILEGRDNDLLELKSGFKSGSVDSPPTEYFAEISQKLKPLEKYPPGRKNHVTISGQGSVLIHGGETFDGKSREPTIMNNVEAAILAV
jgi:hypothetical protein